MHLCEHLLKLNYWPSERDNCYRGWRVEITNFRLKINRILRDSPSLKNYLKAEFIPAYLNGRRLFLELSSLEANLIPQEPDFTLEQALDEDWFPWQPDE
jgi:hypothetical protein